MHCWCDTLKRHFIIPSLIFLTHATRQLPRVSRKSRCCRERRVSTALSMTIDGKGALISACKNVGILVGTRLRATTRTRWMMLRTWMDRFVAKLVPRYSSSITHTHTYTYAHLYLPLRYAENEGEDGDACACNGAPTPCHGLRLRYWAQRDCEWTWMDRMWLPHWATLSEQPEIRHFARYQAPISPSINPASCRFLYLCRSMELITAMANGARTIRSEFAWIANAHAINTARDKYRATTCWLVRPAADDYFKLWRYDSVFYYSPSTFSSKLRIVWE